jgi:hypothetical protein
MPTTGKPSGLAAGAGASTMADAAAGPPTAMGLAKDPSGLALLCTIQGSSSSWSEPHTGASPVTSVPANQIA